MNIFEKYWKTRIADDYYYLCLQGKEFIDPTTHKSFKRSPICVNPFLKNHLKSI